MSTGHVSFINGTTHDLAEYDDVVALLDHPGVTELSWKPDGPVVRIVGGDHAA